VIGKLIAEGGGATRPSETHANLGYLGMTSVKPFEILDEV
jgi:hypothetical protein